MPSVQLVEQPFSRHIHQLRGPNCAVCYKLSPINQPKVWPYDSDSSCVSMCACMHTCTCMYACDRQTADRQRLVLRIWITSKFLSQYLHLTLIAMDTIHTGNSMQKISYHLCVFSIMFVVDNMQHTEQLHFYILENNDKKWCFSLYYISFLTYLMYRNYLGVSYYSRLGRIMCQWKTCSISDE